MKNIIIINSKICLIGSYFCIYKYSLVKQVTIFFLFFFFPVLLFAQLPSNLLSAQKQDTVSVMQKDSALFQKDSIIIVKKVIIPNKVGYDTALKKILDENQFLNTKSRPVALQNKFRNAIADNLLFYVMLAVVF
ncbi:MAG: hypothetical protein HY305_03995, partial [Sphingobacteriales bacterium]|nr:hypothetical protein [Sphingobacteriales bacterium]